MKEEKEMWPEYDFSKGVKGKYAKQYAEGSNIFILDLERCKKFSKAKDYYKS